MLSFAKMRIFNMAEYAFVIARRNILLKTQNLFVPLNVRVDKKVLIVTSLSRGAI